MLCFGPIQFEKYFLTAQTGSRKNTHIFVSIDDHLGFIAEVNLDDLVAEPEDDALLGLGPLLHIAEHASFLRLVLMSWVAAV